jgi:hypothetical protein
VSAGVVAQGLVVTGVGVLIMVVSYMAGWRSTYVSKTTDVLLRWHKSPETDSEGIASWLRTTLALGMAFGGVVIVLGVASVVVGLRG